MRWVFDPTKAYEIGKDFGVPLFTFVAGMIAENLRERRHRHRDEMTRAAEAADAERRATDERRQNNAPFYQVVGNSIDNRGLELRAVNKAAPVNCLDLQAVTPGYTVASWHVDDEELVARVGIPPARGGASCRFELRVRDRAGAERIFVIDLDTTRSPARRDFYEVRDNPPGAVQ